MLFDLLLRYDASENRHDLSVAPDDGRSGQPGAESELSHLLSRHTEPDREIDGRVFNGLSHGIQFGECVGRSAYDLHAVSRITVLYNGQIGHLLLAWPTPCRPEVQHDDPPAVRAQFLFRAEEVFQHQFGFLPYEIRKRWFCWLRQNFEIIHFDEVLFLLDADRAGDLHAAADIAQPVRLRTFELSVFKLIELRGAILRHYRQQRRVAIGDALSGLRQIFRRAVCDFLAVGLVPAIFTTHDLTFQSGASIGRLREARLKEKQEC